MARFTVRIELHSATWEEYEAMYTHLESAGFSDIVKNSKGVEYKMPPAEYNFDGDLTTDEVLALANACAAKVVASYAVLVTKTLQRRWSGLEKA